MIARYRVLADRIKHELTLLNQVVQRCESALEHAASNPVDQDFYAAAAALHMHDFYNGLEQVFRMIAAEVDETVPNGGSCHRDLLTQMMIFLTDIRPAVLTRETVHHLDKYLRFRHLVRHAYALQLDVERVSTLVTDLRPTYELVREELVEFTHFLERLGRADEGLGSQADLFPPK